MAINEPFLPVWPELHHEFRAQREILDAEHRKRHPDGAAATETGRLEAERDRWQAIAALYENQMSVIEPALWRAEQEAEQALMKLHDATKPVGRGQRRGSGPSRAAQLYDMVERYRWYVELDGGRFILKQAVRRAAMILNQKDSSGGQRPHDRLVEQVDGRLDNLLSDYRKEHRRRRRAAGGAET